MIATALPNSRLELIRSLRPQPANLPTRKQPSKVQPPTTPQKRKVDEQEAPLEGLLAARRLGQSQEMQGKELVPEP
jgi:hypothetical protein